VVNLQTGLQEEVEVNLQIRKCYCMVSSCNRLNGNSISKTRVYHSWVTVYKTQECYRISFPFLSSFWLFQPRRGEGKVNPCPYRLYLLTACERICEEERLRKGFGNSLLGNHSLGQDSQEGAGRDVAGKRLTVKE